MLKRKEDWSGRVRELHTLIRGHIRDEEEVEFPRLREFLDESTKPAVAGQISREEAMVQ
jgi:hypothetical protein